MLPCLRLLLQVGIAQFSPNDALVLTETGEDGLEWRGAITSGGGDKARQRRCQSTCQWSQLVKAGARRTS